jgi:hypothetical protein
MTFVNGKVNTTAVTYQTYVNASCQTGYEFDVDRSWVVIWCLANESWSQVLNNCSRMFAFIQKRAFKKKKHSTVVS